MGTLKNYDNHFGDKRGGGRFTLQDFDDGNSKRGIHFGPHDKRGGARFRDDTERDEKRRYKNKVRYANSFSRLDKRLGARFYDDGGFAGDAMKRPGGVGGSRYNSFDDRIKRPGGKAWAYGYGKRSDGSDEYEDDSDDRRKRARSGYPSWLRTG